MRILEGNPGHRPINNREPNYEAHSGRAPEGMTDAAIAEWNRLAPILLPQGLLTVADEPMLVAWCEAWSDFAEARESLKLHFEKHKNYDVVSPASGCLVSHPAIRRKASAVERMGKLSARFGFTPSDRAGIETPEGQTETNVLSKFQRRA